MPQPDFSNVQSGSSSSADKKETSWWELFKQALFSEGGASAGRHVIDPIAVSGDPRKRDFGTSTAIRTAESVVGWADLPKLVGMLSGGMPLQAQAGAGLSPEVDKEFEEYEQSSRLGGAAAGRAIIPGPIQDVREAVGKIYEEDRESFSEGAVDTPPMLNAAGNTGLDMLGMLLDPTNWAFGSSVAKKAGSLEDAIPKSIPNKGVVSPKINLAVDPPIPKEVPKEAPKVTTQEAMQHAGDAASPEAMSRTQSNKFVKIRKSGEVIPVPGVDAIDAKVNPNEILVQIGPDNSVTHIRGSASSPEVSRSLQKIKEKAPEFKTRVDDPDDPIVYYLDSNDASKNFTVIESTPPGYGKVKTFDAVDPDTGLVLAEMETFSPLEKGFKVNKLTGTTGKRFKKASDIDKDVLSGLYEKASEATQGPRLKRAGGSGVPKKAEKKLPDSYKNKEAPLPVYKEDPERGLVRLPFKLYRWAQRNLKQQGMTADLAAKFSKNTPQRQFFRREVPNYFEIQKKEQLGLEFDLQIAQIDLADAIRTTAKNTNISPDFLRKKLWEVRVMPDDPTNTMFLQKMEQEYPELHKAFVNSTNQIDELSKRFINEGVVTTKAEVETLKANMGRYLHRFYEASGDSKWFKKMEDTPEFQKLYDWIATTHKSYNHDQILARMQKYIDNVTESAPDALKNKKTIDRLSLKELEKKYNVPQEVQEFLKVYEDIGVNAEQTSMLMIRDLTLQRMYNNIAEAGTNLGVFRFDASGRFSKKIVGNLGPLDGMYTHPDIAALFKQIDESATTSWWAWASGLEKFAKVGYSHGTQFRNFESGFVMTLANGRLPTNIKTLNLARSVVSGQTRKFSKEFFEPSKVFKLFDVKNEDEFISTVRELYQEGVIGRGAYSGDFEVYLKDIGSKKVTEKIANNRLSQLVARLYRGGDDFWRVYNYTQETKRLKWIHGDQADIGKIKKEASEIVAQQFQTYDRAPEIARKLSRAPAVGPYATFYVEMPRNIINILKRSGHEYKMAVKTGNPKWAVSATSRLGGVMSALSLFGMYEEYKNSKLGISEAEEDALRYFYPNYMENSRAPVTDRDGTTYTILNTSYVNPYALMDSMYIALMRPGDFGDKMQNMAQVVGEQFLAPELLTRAVVEGAVGERIGPMGIGTGGDIRNPSTTVGEQAKDTAYHEYRAMAPGSATSIENLARGAGILDKKDPRFPWREYKFWEEFGAQFGPRWMTLNIDTAFKSHAATFAAKEFDLSREFRVLQQKGDPEIYQKMENNWKQHYQALQRAVLNARILGVSDDYIKENLSKKAGLRKDIISNVLSGTYTSFAEWKKVDGLSSNRLLRTLPPEEQAKLLDAMNVNTPKGDY